MTQFSYQLYSSRNHPPLTETLSMLKAAGYAAVEGFGAMYEGVQDVTGLRDELDGAGLTMPTGHFGLDWLERDFEGAMAVAEGLGIEIVVVPFIMPDVRPKDADGWRAYGKRLTSVAEHVTGKGMSLAYHNHDFEFVALPDGSVPMDLILEAAPSVGWEIDVAWIVRGHADPMEWIKRYKNRIVSTHVKDIAAEGECADEDGWADVGHGTMDWSAILNATKATGCTHFVVEHDRPSDHVRFAQRSIAALQTLED